MSTFNRGRLLRLAKAGKLVMTKSYHFDDMMGERRTANEEIPVIVRTAENNDVWKDKTCYVYESDFKNYGHATLLENGNVNLYIHSNSNLTFKILK